MNAPPSPQVVRLDLSKQRLFIHPDAALPKFNPRPKAVMVVPIYDYDGPLRSPPGSRSGSADGRDAMYTYAFQAAQGAVKPMPHNKSGRRYSSHSPSRRHSYSPDRYSDEQDSRYPSSYAEHRSRPSNHPLVQNPPNYQIQATQGHARPHASYAPSQNYSYGRVNQRARPSTDPLAQNPPNYQLQATQGHAISQGQVHSSHAPSQMQHGPSQSFPLSAPPIAVAVSHSGSATRPNRHSNLFDNLVQDYLRKLPLNPEFCLSRCSGKKRAVCIGINYVGQKDELKGCANDARHMRDFLIQRYGFSSSNILLLTDDDSRGRSPTRKEIFQACMWLVSGAKKDDSLFFHYSGHGGQSEDASGREVDGMDEVIYPLDYSKAGDIIDDELYQALVQPLPAGCRMTAIFDSCHSGTVLDLPYVHSAHGRLRSISHVSRRAQQRGTAPKGDVICFAACRDDEKSTDTFHGGVAVGAMSYALIQSFKRNPRQTYGELLAHLREILVPKYGQKAQISGSHPIDMDVEFAL